MTAKDGPEFWDGFLRDILADKIRSAEATVAEIRKLYLRRCEATIHHVSDGEEMFLADISEVLERADMATFDAAIQAAKMEALKEAAGIADAARFDGDGDLRQVRDQILAHADSIKQAGTQT